MASLIKRYRIPEELSSKRLSKEEKKKLPVIYYIQHMVSGTARRVSTGTESLQIAKEKLRQNGPG